MTSDYNSLNISIALCSLIIVFSKCYFLNFLFNYVYMYLCVDMYICEYRSRGGQKRFLASKELESQGIVRHQYMCWEPNWCSLQEKYALLTSAPSLQSVT